MRRLTEQRAIIFAAVIGGVFAIIAAFISSFTRGVTYLPNPLPTGLPSKTPVPTVVGTPIIGADIAAEGPLGFTVVANDIALVVDEVAAYDKTLNDFTTFPGYAYVVVKARIVNNSSHYISGYNLLLVDDFSNQYGGFPTYSELFGLPQFPTLTQGQSGSGTLVFQVPTATFSNKLRLRLELGASPFDNASTRIE